MRRRNVVITAFVIVWTLFFHYQTFRLTYWNPYAERVWHVSLPRIPLLFPPAGWIMFYEVNPTYGYAEVYGVRDGRPDLLDPHDIFRTRALGYDNIHRNVLIEVLSRPYANSFCRFLRRRFPDYRTFAVVYAQYPDLVNTPQLVQRQVAYRCQ